MAGRTQHTKIESPSARAKLKAQREPFWQSLTERAALGYQRSQGEAIGRRVLRQRQPGTKKYSRQTIGLADDGRTIADGRAVLSFADAKAEALKRLGTIKSPSRFLVRDACVLYIDHRLSRGKDTSKVEGRIAAHFSTLFHIPVAELETEDLEAWHASIAAGPALARTLRGRPRNFKRAALDPEGLRRRRSSANRILNDLKAILNFAFVRGKVSSNVAWGRRLKPFAGADAVRLQYLSISESERLVNASDADFRTLVIAALECGARYAELGRLLVEDYNKDAKTLHIRQSKSGKPRYIALSDSGAKFFASVVAGRAKSELMFRKASGEPWKDSDQQERMKTTCLRARLDPICFHALRHTYASALVMGGCPLLVVSKNLGHHSVTVTEKSYAHLSPSHIRNEINAGAPVFRFDTERKVVGLR